MKHHRIIALTMTALTSFCALAADPPKQESMADILARQAAMPDTSGTGAFAAIKEEVASLPDHVVYRPAQLDKLGKTKLGIYIFGNGACSDDGASSRLHLLEIASHGYVAIAPGRVRNGPGTTKPLDPPKPMQTDAEGKPVFPPSPTKAADLISGLDWILKQNTDPQSPYYKKVDDKAVAVSGYSCGGVQALRVAADPRIKTVIVMNSGLFNAGAAPKGSEMEAPKSLLETLHTPTLYVLGGSTDIAYNNGMDDFEHINHVPVVVANVLNVGHGGTYWQPNGGKAAHAVVAWLDWQLRNDQKAAAMFVGKDCGLCTDPAWEVKKKKID
jgi:hypothetical protein